MKLNNQVHQSMKRNSRNKNKFKRMKNNLIFKKYKISTKQMKIKNRKQKLTKIILKKKDRTIKKRRNKKF